MEIKKRAISLIIFLAINILFFLIIKKSNTKHVKLAIISFVIILTVMAFLYNPLKTADLYRIQEALKSHYLPMATTTLFEKIADSNTPVANIYYFIIAKTGNVRLMPAITALIYYSIVCYIAYDNAKEKKYSSSILASSILMFMSFGQFLEVISGIRTMLSFSIISYCVYEEQNKNKRVLFHIPIYIIASLIHPVGLIASLVRITAYILKESKGRVITKVATICAIIAVMFIGQNIILGAFEKGSNYINSESYKYTWEYIIGILTIVFIVTSANLHGQKNLVNTKILSLLFILLAVILFQEYNTFHRLVILSTMISIPLIQDNLYFLQETGRKKRIAMYHASALTIGLLSLIRGNLSGLILL